MAGIDQITSEILQEARSAAEGILAEARAKADTVLAEASAECDTIAADAARDADKKTADIKKRTASQASLAKRQAQLQAKQDIIESVIGKAYASLESQDDASYFGMIGKLLKKAVRPEEGTISLSEKDLKRLPGDFGTLVSAIAKECGGKLTVSDTPAKIDSGFVLNYGGIEENCSLKALFASMKDQLQDTVNAVLW